MQGCLTEFELYEAFRDELPVEVCRDALRHVLQCPLCNEQWHRFELDDQIATGIRSALAGDADGADETPRGSEPIELPDDLEVPGFRLSGEYVDGGQARVYRAIHEASHEDVAIKVFYNSALNEGGELRFSRELQSLARLRHPNVVPIRSAGEILGCAYFVMPWIEAEPITTYAARQRLDAAGVVDLMIKVTSAVDHAHKRGVMHLDLTPNNVRVDASGEPMVMDFGLARSLAGDDDPELVGLGVAGTPAYMAPDQVRHRADIDIRADVFMLGLLLYELLSGQRARQVAPGDARQGDASLDLALAPPPALRSIKPSIGRELEAIVGLAAAMDREQRYPTAAALLDDLRGLRQGRAVQAMGTSWWYRGVKLSRWHLAAVGCAVAVVLILSTGIAVRREIDRSLVKRYGIMVQTDSATVRNVLTTLGRAYQQLADMCAAQGDDVRAEAFRVRARAAIRRSLSTTLDPLDRDL